jgi:glucose/mannose transport system substrate-binding protein
VEAIMASQGMAAYEAWINGRLTAADDARLASAFAVLRRFLSYANADHARTDWDAAIKRVIAGEGALCLMGDWADGEFRLARKEYGRDYEAIPVPGTAGLYGVAVDGFAQARGVADPASAQRFLRFAASRAAQDAFCVRKGGVPARLDADASRYGRYQRAAIAELKAARVIYPSLNGAAHDAFKSSLDQVMARFAQDPDVKRGAGELARAAAESQGRFKTVWALR